MVEGGTRAEVASVLILPLSSDEDLHEQLGRAPLRDHLPRPAEVGTGDGEPLGGLAAPRELPELPEAPAVDPALLALQVFLGDSSLCHALIAKEIFCLITMVPITSTPPS